MSRARPNFNPTSRWLDDGYSKVVADNFVGLVEGLTAAAIKTLAEAGMDTPPLPRDPPGGIDPVLWDTLRGESAADVARAFAEENPTPEVIDAAKRLVYLERVRTALNESRDPLLLVEAASFLATTVSLHMKAEGVATPALAKIEGLAGGPPARSQRQNRWKEALSKFLTDLRKSNPLALNLTARELWKLWIERDPKEVEKLQHSREVQWPSEATGMKEVQKIVREMTSH